MDLRNAKIITERYLKKAPKKGLKESFVFGSYANGNNHENSDIDLALVYESIDDIIEFQIKLMNLRDNSELGIEPHPFRVGEFNHP